MEIFIMELETILSTLLITFIISAFIGVKKLYFKGLLIISPFVLIPSYFLLLNTISETGSDLTKYINNAHTWQQFKSDIRFIEEDYIFVAGELSAQTLIDKNYGISTTGQYLVKEYQVREQESYECDTEGEYDTRCHRMIWVTKDTEQTFNEKYTLSGAPIARSVIARMAKTFPLEDVFVETYPPTHEYNGRTLYPVIEHEMLVYQKNENTKGEGDIRVRFLIMDIMYLSILGEVNDNKVEALKLYNSPLLLDKIITLNTFITAKESSYTIGLTTTNIGFIVFMYLSIGLLYRIFGLSNKLLPTMPRKVVYFLTPLIAALIFNAYLIW